MEHGDTVVFIDANLYLDLYEVTKGKKLLDTLREQQNHIFVTIQLVEEVQRRKLQVAKEFLTRQFKNLESRNIVQRIGEVNEDPIAAAVETLRRISLSEDEVSKALHDIFSQAVKPEPEELQRARERKERGNPPGKKTGPLGDQLTWEQLLSHCKGKSKPRLWIISKDEDFLTEYYDTVLLNPLLHQDLARIEPAPEVFCFSSIDKGIRDFVERTKVRAEKLPTPEESKAIEKELNSLPPRGWLDTSMDDAYIVEMLTRRQRQISPALWAAISNDELPLRMTPVPDKTDK